MRRAQAFNPIRAMESAWRLVIKAPLPMAVGGLILVVVQQVSGAGFQFGNDPTIRFHGDISHALPVLGPLLVIGLAMFLVLYGVVAWLSVGYYNGVAEVMRTGTTEFGKLYDSRGRWLTVLLARVLRDVIGVMSFGLLLIPVVFGIISHEALDFDEGVSVLAAILGGLALLPIIVYLWLGLVFVPQAVALEDIGPVEAIARSWKLASGKRLWLLLFALITFAIGLLGLILCCFGGLQASGILIEVMWTEAYVQATTGEETDGWWITTGQDVGPSGETADDDRWPAPESPVEPPVASSPTPPPPAEPEPPDEVASAPEPEDSGAFDPGAWRDQIDIPPFDEDSKS